MDIQSDTDSFSNLPVVVQDDSLTLLPISRIDCFERDPRLCPNSEYARIRASILASGLNQPLVVTRRPGAESFIIAAGGNTRLRILRELYSETGDQRFASVHCVIKPWPGESEVLIAHLRENDLRGDLSFFDKARAVAGLRELLAKDRDGQLLSNQEAAQCLRDRGYALSATSLWFMDYAVVHIAPKLPQALAHGFGRKETERLCALERAARSLWKEAIGESDEFEDVFTALCQRHDGEVWDEASLRYALEAELADRLNQSVHAARLALDAKLAGTAAVSLPRHDDDEDEWPTVAVPEPRASRAAPDRRDKALDNRNAVPGGGDLDATADPLPHAFLGAGQGRNEAAPATLEALRVEMAEKAAAFAAHFRLESLVASTKDFGLGFIVTDTPPVALIETLDEMELATISIAWWQLVACAEMTAAPPERLLPRLSESSVVFKSLERQDGDLLFNAVWTLDPGQVGFRLWRVLGETAWCDLIGMMTTYRQLHQVAEIAGIDLWTGGAP